MMTLNDLFDVMLNITDISITARDANGRFLHEWRYADDPAETLRMYHDKLAGRLTIRDVKLNAHGTTKGNGQPEMGWGVRCNLIHKQLREAPVTHLNVVNLKSMECQVWVDIELPEMTVEILKNEEGVLKDEEEASV